MNAVDRRQVEQAFSAAADYDRYARVQRLVAKRLADRIVRLDLPPRPRILEIGCGTGFLTEALIERGLAGNWLITDLSPEMIARCRGRVGEAEDRRFAVLDGEYGTPGQFFDLICSSLAMQWFDDHGRAFARMADWLAPGGHCMATTLAADSFAEWRAAHREAGMEPGTPPFLSVKQLAAQHVEHHLERHESALDFMRALKAIGAHTAARWHRPLPPTALRRMMRHFEESGCVVSYEIATCHYRRPSGRGGDLGR